MKSTSITGAVQVIRLLFGLIRNKMIALLFGPAGLGIWGLYLSFIEMMQSAVSLGLEKSAVKEIAENHNNIRKRNLAIQVSQYAVGAFSFICAAFVGLFASDISESLFGSADYKIGIWACSAVIFINAITAMLRAVLNGLSEIKELAISQLTGVLLGNIIVFVLLPFFEASAIPFYFLVISIAAFIPVILCYRRLGFTWVKLTLKESTATLSGLMKLGLAFWVSAFFMALTTYIINIFIKDEFSLAVVGVYQASWIISNLYIGVILSSMGVAFFPKVCKTIDDAVATKKVINDQIEFGLLISLPFVLLFYIFAPIFLMVLYSESFESGEPIIRWLMLGVIIRLLGFPFGYALMAKGKSLLYVVAQITFSAANYLLLILAVKYYGLDGLGVNYFMAYCLYAILIGLFCYTTLGYKVSMPVVHLAFAYLFFIILSLITIYFIDGVLFYACGMLIVGASSVFSFRQLTHQMDVDVIGYIKSKVAR